MSKNKAQHTPGPWKAIQLPPNETWKAQGHVEADGKPIAMTARIEDARLIAAAPELLEAEEDAAHTLKTITEICDALATWENDMPLPVRQKITHIANIAEQARAKSGKAISKAKGGEV